jgi:hypothetical protein
MSRFDVIESKHWVRDDGRTASIYGAVPWTSRGEAQAWIDKETARLEEARRLLKGASYPTKAPTKRGKRSHATKKSPAQLQREIDEVLAKGGSTDLSPAQRAYVALFEQDVRSQPEAYKASVRADPAGYARQLVEGLDDADVRQFTRDLRSEMKKVARLTGGARKKRSAGPPVVGSHGLGTADVRSDEGAYWIVTRPKGYRVDYKPWGPSSEVDLGMFPSRRRAREKIAEHALSLGAVIQR